MEDAEPVEEALDLARRRGEGLLRPLVADEHKAAVREQAAGRLQHLDWVGHVVERLEDRDQVVPPRETGIRGVSLVELDAVLDAAPLEVAPRELDRRPV